MDESNLKDGIHTSMIQALNVARCTSQTKTNLLDKFKTDMDDIIKAKINLLDSSKENIIDSKRFKGITRDCYSILVDKSSTPICKLKIIDLLARRLNYIHKMNENQCDIVEKILTSVYLSDFIDNEELRLYYLKIPNNRIVQTVSRTLVKKSIRDRMEVRDYLQILKRMLRYESIESCDKDMILNELNDIFIANDIFIKMEVADIMILNGYADIGEDMLNIIREIEMNEINTSHSKNNIYQDSQNVHSSNINKSVLKASVKLMKLEEPEDYDDGEIKSILFEHTKSDDSETRDIICIVLRRIDIDESKFSVDKNTFKLYNVFSSLLKYIKKHSYANELYKRLISEMVEMHKYCSTGHLSRLISSIQGFTEDPELTITISDSERTSAVIRTYLDAELSEYIHLLEEDQIRLYEYIQTLMNVKIEELIDDGHEIENIISSLEVYTTQKWRVEKENTLAFELENIK